MQTVYKWWAGLLLVAVVLQVGFAGYGAFFVADKLDGDGKTIDEDRFRTASASTRASATSSGCWGSSSSSSGSSPGSGAGGSAGTACSSLLLTLQVLLAWFGFEVPAIGFFHPVNALLIFVVLALDRERHLARRQRRWTPAPCDRGRHAA